MKKDREPYHWPVSRIVAEHELILKKECKLSSNQRRAVEYIYNQHLHKGTLPGQKEVFGKEMEGAILAAEGVVLKLREQFKRPNEPLSSFTLVMEEPEPGQVANFMLSHKGDFLGWIIVHRENQTYKAKYYVENPKEQAGVKKIGPGPQKADVKRGDNDQGDSAQG